MLDKNNLTTCYAPVNVQDNPKTETWHGPLDPAGQQPAELPAKSGPADRPGAVARRDESNAVLIPPPEMLGIRVARRGGHEPGNRRFRDADPLRASGWHPRAERTDLKLGSEFDNDRFGSMPAEPVARDSEPAPSPPARPRTKSSSKWRAVQSSLPALSTTR